MRKCRTKRLDLWKPQVISRLQRFEDFIWLLPGPIAQAITFRAVGAENQCFSYFAVVLGSISN